VYISVTQVHFKSGLALIQRLVLELQEHVFSKLRFRWGNSCGLGCAISAKYTGLHTRMNICTPTCTAHDNGKNLHSVYVFWYSLINLYITIINYLINSTCYCTAVYYSPVPVQGTCMYMRCSTVFVFFDYSTFVNSGVPFNRPNVQCRSVLHVI
jgi:hypothetical protein